MGQAKFFLPVLGKEASGCLRLSFGKVPFCVGGGEGSRAITESHNAYDS